MSKIKVQTNRGLVDAVEIGLVQGSSFFDINADTIAVSPQWQGKMVRFLKACTVTIPKDLPSDFSCGWSQETSGIVTFVAGTDVTLDSVSGNKKSSGQFAMGGISGWGTARFRLYGSLSA